MTDYLFYLLLGSGAGAIIAALGLGMVVTYQGSGVVNFAAGSMAMWGTYVYAELRNGAYVFPIPGLPDRYHFGDDVGFRWAMLLALLTAALLGLVVYALVFKPLRQAPALAKVVASVGLIIVFIEFIDARKTMTDARLNHNRVRAEFLLRIAELEFAVGDPRAASPESMP